jgi:hypothetical protein
MLTMVQPMVFFGRNPTNKTPKTASNLPSQPKPIKHQQSYTFQPATAEQYHLQHIYTGRFSDFSHMTNTRNWNHAEMWSTGKPFNSSKRGALILDDPSQTV